jgi:predicted Fe-S protein YdhL (DUF1289 family)
MQDKHAAIESPCVRNCCLNEDNVCLGCFRTVAEIMEWGSAPGDERRSILVKAMRRRHAYHLERLKSQASVTSLTNL